MTIDEFLVFGSWIVSAVAVYCVFAAGIPVLARLLFVARMERIRDEASLARLNGVLTDADVVKRFIDDCDETIRYSRHVTLARAEAMHAARRARGEVTISDPEPTYGHLPPKDRHLMHRLDAEVQTAVTCYLFWGSALAVPISMWDLTTRFFMPKAASEREKSGAALAREVTEAPRELPKLGKAGRLISV
jgi:hypothetical protein